MSILKNISTGAYKVVSILLAVLFCAFMLVACNNTANNYTDENTKSPEEVVCPWEEGGKKPSKYTWEEFEKLSGPQQIEFQKSFSSTKKFDKWMKKAKNEDKGETNPWEKKGAKQPSDYTWEEFDALTDSQQVDFQDSFGSTEKFDEWMQNAESEDQTETNPWEKEGAKQPADYTWKEFDELTGPQQIEFQRSFDAPDGFDKWLKANEPK